MSDLVIPNPCWGSDTICGVFETFLIIEKLEKAHTAENVREFRTGRVQMKKYLRLSFLHWKRTAVEWKFQI